MHVRLAVSTALVVLSVAAWPAAAADRTIEASPLTLDAAFARVAEFQGKSHPELRWPDARGNMLAAERDGAGLPPPLTIGATIENAFGSGEARGLNDAELTLTLASVLERGGKLEARRVLAQSRIDALAVERESRRLDLLAEVARRYLAAAAARHQREIAALDILQRRRTVAAARQRLAAGASPESVVFQAQAALARAELDRDRAAQRYLAARQHLAALWGERSPGFDIAATDPLRMPEIDGVEALAAWLERTPELSQFADERRIREARVRLARSQADADLDWQVGVRGSQAGEEVGIVAGLSIALGARARAEPGIRAAEADVAALEIEREARGLALYSTLIEAHGRYRVARLEVRRLADDVLPKLANAEAAAERAYRAGAISYLEWAQLQSERTATRRQQLETALDAQRALIELQRLTGRPLTVAPATEQGTTP